MERVLKIPVKSSQVYISLFNFLFGLTRSEIEILSTFIDMYMDLAKLSVNVNPFSTEIKKRVAQKLGRDDFNTLNNYIKSLADKGAIIKQTEGYEINELLIPKRNITKIVFELDHG